MNIWKNNNTLGRYRESLPLEDRDDYVEWKKDYDYKNTSEYKRNKFRSQLDTKRNKEGVVKAWKTFGQDILDFCSTENDDIEDLISAIVHPSDGDRFVIDILNDEYSRYDNIRLIIEPEKNSVSYYDNNFNAVIDDVITSKKAYISLIYDFMSESLSEDDSENLSKCINLYIKDAIESGYNRNQVSNTKNFLLNFKKEIKPYIDSIRACLGTSSSLIVRDLDTYCNSGIFFIITLEIPYNFGIKDNSSKKMIDKAELIAKNIYKLNKYIKPLLLNTGRSKAR